MFLSPLQATQAAKKPKTESSQAAENSVAGPSTFQHQGDGPLGGLSSSNPSFPKAGASFSVSLSLDALAGAYNPASHSNWPQSSQSVAGYPSACIKQEPLSIPLQEPTLPLQTSASSLLQHPPLYKTEKTLDLSPVKQELKGAGSVKHQPPPQSGYLPPAPPPAQKLSLDKYREKHAAELLASSQKRCVEQHGGAMDCDRGDMFSSCSTSSSSLSYAPTFPSQVDHRKHSQAHPMSHGGGVDSTASPVKMKGPPSASTSTHDKRHYGDKRDKAALKLRLAVPGTGSSSQAEKGGGQSNKDELRMKIKVSSSERHSSSDEGAAANSKSKHSSPLVSKEKHRGAEHHGLHRHHKHSHPHSGNGRAGPEAPGGLLRAPPGLVAMDGTPLGPPGSTSVSSSRKRLYPEAGHNHHHHHHHPSTSFSTSCSKVSKLSKGGSAAAGIAFCLFPSALSSSTTSFSFPPLSDLLFCHTPGGLRTSQQYPPPGESPHEVGEQRH